MIDIRDRAGKPISHQQWMHLFQDRAYQVLGVIDLGAVTVSTVWMGFPPRLFETRVFGPGQVSAPADVMGYSTEAEAIAGHAFFVEKWNAQQPFHPPDVPAVLDPEKS